jgi:hypothetical protein
MRRLVTAFLGLAFPVLACQAPGPSTDDGDDEDSGSATGEEGPENTNAACMDGIDNDGNNFVDCDDFDCSMNPDVTVCDGATSNPTGQDDDDGTGGDKEDTDEECSDGIDNDGNNFVDCDDYDCSMNPDVTVCGGGGQDTGNGEPENTDALCMDEIDNNDNGYLDCVDFECSMNDDVTVCDGPEDSDEACSNGWDDDDNGYIDCEDFDCSMNPEVTVCPPENTDELCMDGEDNDLDGFVDCDDYDCSMNPDVTVCGETTGEDPTTDSGGSSSSG